MDQRMNMMRQFHEKFGFAQQRLDQIPVNAETKIHDSRLKAHGIRLFDEARHMLDEALDAQAKGDSRLYRAHLMMEELGELLKGMGNRDEVETADALADLDYVTTGSAYTMDLPLPQLFEEVHASNMSKQRGPRNMRMRDKGPDYFKPNILSVIREHREAAVIKVSS